MTVNTELPLSSIFTALAPSIQVPSVWLSSVTSTPSAEVLIKVSISTFSGSSSIWLMAVPSITSAAVLESMPVMISLLLSMVGKMA